METNPKPRYIKSQAVKDLEKRAFEIARLKYPNVPVHALHHENTKITAQTDLQSVLLKLDGWQAERISNTGRYLDKTKTFTDVVGQSRTIGTKKWIPGTGTNGTADISATINGKSVKIEVKFAKDVQRIAQREYQTQVEKAGGIYLIAQTFEQFVSDYNKLFSNGK